MIDGYAVLLGNIIRQAIIDMVSDYVEEDDEHKSYLFLAAIGISYQKAHEYARGIRRRVE